MRDHPAIAPPAEETLEQAARRLEREAQDRAVAAYRRKGKPLSWLTAEANGATEEELERILRLERQSAETAIRRTLPPIRDPDDRPDPRDA